MSSGFHSTPVTRSSVARFVVERFSAIPRVSIPDKPNPLPPHRSIDLIWLVKRRIAVLYNLLIALYYTSGTDTWGGFRSKP